MGQITFLHKDPMNLDNLVSPDDVTRRFFAEIALLFAYSVADVPIAHCSRDELTLAIGNTNTDAFRRCVFDTQYYSDHNVITVLSPDATNIKIFVADGVINIHSNSPMLESLMCDIIVKLHGSPYNDTYRLGCLLLLYALHKVFNYDPCVLGSYLHSHELCYSNLQCLEKMSDICKLEHMVVVFNTETEDGDEVITYPVNMIVNGCMLTLLGEVLEFL